MTFSLLWRNCHVRYLFFTNCGLAWSTMIGSVSVLYLRVRPSFGFEWGWDWGGLTTGANCFSTAWDIPLSRSALTTELSHYPIMLYHWVIPLSHSALPLSYPTISWYATTEPSRYSWKKYTVVTGGVSGLDTTRAHQAHDSILNLFPSWEKFPC